MKEVNNIKKELKLILPLPKSVNALYGINRFGTKYLKREGKEYKKNTSKYIKEEVKKQGWKKLEKGKYCYIDEVVYMNRLGRDSDNLKKLTQDAITESYSVWEDDTYCLARTNRVYVDSNNPRIELVITPVKFIGIFDNKKQMNEFIKICKNCSKYRNGSCSVLNDSINNKITKDVININGVFNCSKFKEKRNK